MPNHHIQIVIEKIIK